MRGRSPRVNFCVSVPDEGGAAEDEVMGVMIYWGNGTAPTSPTLFLVGTYIKSFVCLFCFV